MREKFKEKNMANPIQKVPLQADDFLSWVVEQPIRYEFVDGDTFAMAGAEDRHVMIAGNAYMALRHHLKGSPCRTFMSDMFVHAEEANSLLLPPDVMVTCSAKDAEDRLVKREPTLVLEVLSKSTAAYDRGDKFQKYRTLGSLKEYVLIGPIGRTTDVYRKGDDGLWVLHPFAKEQAIELASVNLAIQSEDLFAEAD
jgi:Uma2 family endonuclease